jgi:hypothetical protein
LLNYRHHLLLPTWWRMKAWSKGDTRGSEDLT